MTNRIAIIKETVEGQLMWCVKRHDNSVLTDDGVVSFNFDLADWQKAIDCHKSLTSN